MLPLGVAMGDESYSECRAQELYDEFVSASTCRTALRTFTQLCEHLQLDRSAAERPLYQIIKRRLNYWRANTLWTKLDRRANQQEYLRARICNNTTVQLLIYIIIYMIMVDFRPCYNLDSPPVMSQRVGTL